MANSFSWNFQFGFPYPDHFGKLGKASCIIDRSLAIDPDLSRSSFRIWEFPGR